MNNGKIETFDFLLEIGTEELPSKSLRDLSGNLAFNIEKGLQGAGLSYERTSVYVSPRRLAVIVWQLSEKQKDYTVEKRGPALNAAFEEDGAPTQACVGFAASCGVAVSELKQYKTSGGAWVLYSKDKKGETVFELMPTIVKEAIKELPIPKSMRWGDKDIVFVRPVHWVVMLYGNNLIGAEILGVKTTHDTYGHRFYNTEPINIENASKYSAALFESGHVIADFDQRKEKILQELSDLASDVGTLVIDDDLLNETAGLVEWPKAFLCGFDKEFLDMPSEILTSVIKNRQRCFYLVDKDGKLLPHFITICNIDSKDPLRVIKGNERVMRARLNDMQFFYNSDIKNPLESYVERLKDVVYQPELGSLYDKVTRIERLTEIVANKIGANVEYAKRAAFLSKADLTTEVVKEMPELQGVMNYYYALFQNEPKEVALAAREHYLPRFSGDILPNGDIACSVALADRLDNLIGAFGTNQIPTGDKDPFGLKRTVLAMIRILIEKQLPLDLEEMLREAKSNYHIEFKKSFIPQVMDFVFDRLRGWYLEQNVPSNVFNAVLSCSPKSLSDFQCRINAIQNFQNIPQAASLIAAYKRINNILKKAFIMSEQVFDAGLLVENAEKELASELLDAEKIIWPLYTEGFYTEALKIIAEMKNTIDNFFDSVMVMAEDEKLRNNRLALLIKLKTLFSYVADVSLL